MSGDIALKIITPLLSLLTVSTLSVCLYQRICIVEDWKKQSLIRWLLIITYVDSYAYVLGAGILRNLKLDASLELCDTAIIYCLCLYMTTKSLMYLLLVEKVRLVYSSFLPRMKDKFFLFNCLSIFVPYSGLFIMSFVYRIHMINDAGLCLIGIGRAAIIPITIFDFVVNMYLTILFILPFLNLPSFQNKHSQLKRMTYRTFFGSLATLTSTLAYITSYSSFPAI